MNNKGLMEIEEYDTSELPNEHDNDDENSSKANL